MQTSIRFLFPIVCLLACGAGQPRAVERTAEFQVVSRGGARHAFTLTSLKGQDGKNVLDRCKDRVCRNLDIERYRYSVRVSPSGEVVEGHVLLIYPTELVTIFYEPQNLENSGIDVSGRIRANSPLDRVWVRLVTVFANETRDTRVKNDGTFQIRGLLVGPYVVLVIKDQRVVAHRTFDCCLWKGRDVVPIDIEVK